MKNRLFWEGLAVSFKNCIVFPCSRSFSLLVHCFIQLLINLLNPFPYWVQFFLTFLSGQHWNKKYIYIKFQFLHISKNKLKQVEGYIRLKSIQGKNGWSIQCTLTVSMAEMKYNDWIWRGIFTQTLISKVYRTERLLIWALTVWME